MNIKVKSKASVMKKIKPLQLAAVIFFTVSGGPFGIEPLLTYAGERAALLLLIITPVLWDVPAIFTVLELNSMMPVNGGYYKWVKRALGNRWGFYEGFWTWLYTFVDLAIYPVLFVQYASFLFPGLEAYKIPICLLIIWSCAGLNILGIRSVGRASVLLSAVVIVPFCILFFVFLSRHTGAINFPSPSLKGLAFPSLGLSLYTIMWNCLGWDSVTTYADEVEHPIRSYIKATIIAFVAVIVVYVSVIMVAQQSHINYEILTKQGFPALGKLIGGDWLGILIASAGLAGTIGLYNANLLSVSRLPKAMADDGLLPAALNKLHTKFQTPYISILTCSVVISLMVLWTFGELVIIDVTIYGAGLFLEYISLIRLRIDAPDVHRPFKIPLNVPGLCVLALCPVVVYAVALTGVCLSSSAFILPAVFAIVILFSAEVGWQVVLRKNKI
jgi:amino acid transporter